jgi:hypothetical protein
MCKACRCGFASKTCHLTHNLAQVPHYGSKTASAILCFLNCRRRTSEIWRATVFAVAVILSLTNLASGELKIITFLLLVLNER